MIHSCPNNSFKNHVPVLTECFCSQPQSTCSLAPTFHFAPGQGVKINSSGSKPWLGYIKHLCESSFSLSSSYPVLMGFFLLFQFTSCNLFQHNRSLNLGSHRSFETFFLIFKLGPQQFHLEIRFELPHFLHHQADQVE